MRLMLGEGAIMALKEPKEPAAPTATRGRLADLVDEKLNRPLADEVAEELDKKREAPARSGAGDYAHGTPEHEDDRDA